MNVLKEEWSLKFISVARYLLTFERNMKVDKIYDPKETFIFVHSTCDSHHFYPHILTPGEVRHHTRHNTGPAPDLAWGSLLECSGNLCAAGD